MKQPQQLPGLDEDDLSQFASAIARTIPTNKNSLQ